MNELIKELQEIERQQESVIEKIERLQRKAGKQQSKKERNMLKSLRGQISSIKNKAKSVKLAISQVKINVRVSVKKIKTPKLSDLNIDKMITKRPHIITPFDFYLNGKHSGTATSIWNTIKDQPNREELIQVIFQKIEQIGPDALGKEWGSSYFDAVVGYDDKSDNAIYVNDEKAGLKVIETWRNDILTRKEQEANRQARMRELGLEE